MAKKKARNKSSSSATPNTTATGRGVIDAAARAASELDAIGARFALVGGLAVSARAEPRYTRDVDLAVSVTNDEEAEQVIHAMTNRGYVVATVLENQRAKRLATVRLVHQDQADVFVDLLFASSGIEPELIASADQLVVQTRSTSLPVARVGHLIALKVLSENERRLQDRIDLQSLATIASADDWATAEGAVRLVRGRGYHRGRALRRRLREWRERTSK